MAQSVVAQRVLEISDLVIDRDPATLARIPVRRDAVVAELIAAGDRRGARIVAGMPAPQGVLVPEAVDRLLVRAHTELQRLNEELRMPEQLTELLRPILAAVSRPGQRTRLVDVGCGLGYTVRWLAAKNALPGTEVCGVDFNEALIGRAGQLADAEGLDCRFVHGDAFALPETATVFISSGVLHHLRGNELAEFFQAQAVAGARAYCHFDIAATRLAPVGPGSSTGPATEPGGHARTVAQPTGVAGPPGQRLHEYPGDGEQGHRGSDDQRPHPGEAADDREEPHSHGQRGSCAGQRDGGL